MPKSPENNPKNTQKQKPTENQKNAKTEIWVTWETCFYI